MIRVLIADDHLAVREGVRGILSLERDIQVVGEAVDGPSTLRLARELRPDLIVLDNSMPGMSGLDVARTLTPELPDTGIVFLTMDPTLRDLALAGGATAYVVKDAPSDELPRAIRATAEALETRRRHAQLPPAWRRVVDLLLGSRVVTGAQLDAALTQCAPSESLAGVLVRTGAVAEQELAETLARASGTPLVSLAPFPDVGPPIQPSEQRLAARRMFDPVDRAAARLLPLDISRGLGIAITAASRGEGVVAMADPLDDGAHAEAERHTRLRLTRVTATAFEIRDTLQRAWEPAAQLPVIVTGDRDRRALAALASLALMLFALFLFLFRDALTPRLGFSLFALACGLFFFTYALKYYVTSAAVLAAALFADSLVFFGRGGTGHRNGNHGKANGNGTNGNGNHVNAEGNGRAAKVGNGSGGHREGYTTLRGETLDQIGSVVVGDPWPRIGELRLPAERQPFVSVHLALYNEKRVVDRLLAACTSFDYENYEVIVVDDSTDETVQILARWKSHPRVRVVHRPSRAGFKGGALQEALRRMHPRTEYVMVFDADFVPPSDAIWHFLDYFGRLPANGNGNGHNGNGNGHKNGNGNGSNGVERRRGAATQYAGPERRRNGNGNGRKNGNGAPANGDRLAAVQGYQWHMLNASENWVTKGVRAEYSGSYVLERAGQELFGTMKMISGSVYMIRADVLRRLGWSTSITEDWELTIRLYLAGYKVLYTPYIQAPAECVSTIRRLIRQRMRWAEGHTYNVKKYFLPILRSPNLTWREKLEFVYYAPYYLQSVLFAVGTLSWILGIFVLGQKLPMWGELFGWTLVLSNALALPVMNLAGIVLEGSLRRDAAGLLSFIGLSWLLVPFQAYAALKGLFEREEGGWARTPKSGRVTEALAAFRLARLLRWELPGRRRPQAKRPSRAARVAAASVLALLAAGILSVGLLSMRALAASGAGSDADYAVPALVGTALPLGLLLFGWLRTKRRFTAALLALCLGVSTNVLFLANAIPAAAVTDNSSVFTFRNTTTFNSPNKDMVQNYTPTNQSIAFVQSTSAVITTANPALAYTSSVTAGNFLVAVCKSGTNVMITNLSDNLNGNWTLAVEAVVTGIDRTDIWYRANTLGGAVTVTCSTTGTDNAMTIAEFSGVATVAPLDKTATATGTGATLTTANTLPLVQSGELVFAGFATNNGTFTAGTSDATAFTIASQATLVASDQSIAGEYILSSTANAQRGNITSTSTGPGTWMAVVATFKPAVPTCPSTATNNWTCRFSSDTFSAIQSMSAGTATADLYLENNPSTIAFRAAASAEKVGSIRLRGAGTAAAAASGNVAPGLPTGWQPDDIHIAVIESRDNVAPTMPAAWTQLNTGSNGTQHQATLFWRRAVSGDTAPTITHTGGDAIIAQIMGFRLVDTVTAFDATNSFTSNASSLTVTAGGLTTVTPATGLVFTAHMAANNTSQGLPTPGTWTQAFFSTTALGLGASIAADYATFVCAGAQPSVSATTTGTASVSHGAQLALRPDPSLTIGKPAGTVTGDVMIATVAPRPVCLGSSAANVITAPAGWTLLRRTEASAGTWTTLATYYKVAGASEPASYTWAFTEIHSVSGGIQTFSGVNTTTPIDVEDGWPTPVCGTPCTHSTPSVTTTVQNTMVVTGHVTSNINNTWTPPTGMTQGFAAGGCPGGCAVHQSTLGSYVAQAAVGATGAKTATGSGGTGNSGVTHILALRPVPRTCALTVNLLKVSGGNVNFRAAASASAASGVTTLTVGKPTGTAQNDVMIASIAFRPNTATIAAPAGWTLVRRVDNANPTQNSLAVYRLVAGASEPASYSWILGMPITFRAAASAGAASGVLTLSISTPTGTVQNDVMIASIAVRPNTATITAPAGWTLIRRVDSNAGTSNSLAVYQRIAGATEPASYSWSFSASTGSAGGIQSFSGVDTTTPIDVENGQPTPVGTTHATPSVTTTVPNAMLVTSHAFSSPTTWAPPAGMTEAFDVLGGSESIEGNYAIQSAAGATGAKTATAAADPDGGVTHILALRPAGPTGSAGGIQSFSGVDTATPIDVENGQNTPFGASHATPDVTTTVANAMLVTSHAYSSSNTWTPPAGMTEAFEAASVTPPSTGGISIEGNYVTQGAAGATGAKTGTATAGTDDAGNAHILALRPATTTTTIGTGSASMTGPGGPTLVSTTFATSAVTFADGDRLALDVVAPSDAANCSTRLSYDTASQPSKLTVATIVPEGALGLLGLALGLPVAFRRWLVPWLREKRA